MKNLVVNPFTGETLNEFCATGDGGGVDPSCGKGGSQRTLKGVQDDYYKLNIEVKDVEKELLAAAGPFRKNPMNMDLATRKSTIGAAMSYLDVDVKSALKSRKVPKDLKEKYKDLKERLQKLSDEGDELSGLYL